MGLYDLREHFVRKDERTFSSSHKWMAVLVQKRALDSPTMVSRCFPKYYCIPLRPYHTQEWFECMPSTCSMHINQLHNATQFIEGLLYMYKVSLVANFQWVRFHEWMGTKLMELSMEVN